MKIFIIAPDHIDKLDLANKIVSLNDNLNICKTFTSINSEGLIGKYRFNLDIDDIMLSFRNNALLFIDYNDENVCGITLDDYGLSDIIIITPKHFNSIPDIYLSNEEILIILLDSKKKIDKDIRHKDIIESGYVQNRANEMCLPLMFFVDENIENISNIILDYVNGDSETRSNIILENS